MKSIKRSYVVMMALIMSMSVSAQLTKPNGGGVILGGGCAGGAAIADDGYDGSIGSMQCMNITGPGGIITDINLDLAVDHTFIGDLAVKIVAPGGAILTVMNRPGFAEPADDGTGGFGFGSDLSSAAVVNYANGAATSAEDMGVTAVAVVCQDDGLCDYAPSPGLGEGIDFNDYIGIDSAGTWQVCVGDSAGADTGFLCPATTLNFTAGPPPSAGVLLNPAAGSNISFGSGAANGSANVTISNDGAATLNLTNINCSFAGGDAANFTVNTPMPAGPLAPGASIVVQMSATVGQGETLSSSLTCTYDGDVTNGSSTWPVSIAGVPRVIPSLNTYGLLALIALFMFGAVVVRRKFV